MRSPSGGRGAIAVGAASAQPPPGPPRTGPGYPQVYDPNMPFDAKEIAGIWTPNAVGFGGGGRCRDCGDRGFSHEFPGVHAGRAGRVRREHSVVRPRARQRGRGGASRGAHRPAPRAAAGARQRSLSAVQSDGHPARDPLSDPEEFIVLPDRILQHFQWGYGLRTIWMDGRTLPKPEEVDIARWWGYAVGRWDGNTLVVTSTGYDGRSWVDHFGYPHSDMMVLEERYTRINYDTLELKMTLTDPVYYAEPWVVGNEAHASDPARLHPVVGLERLARGSVRARRRGRYVQSADSRSGRHGPARGAAAR